MMFSKKKNIEKAKIIILLGTLEVGGAEKQAFNYAKYLKKKNIGVKICALNTQGKLAKLCELEGIAWEIISIKNSRTRFGMVLDFIQYWWYFFCQKPDIIISYTLVPNVIAGVIWKYTKAKLFIWNQRDEGIESYTEKYYSYAVRNASTVISNSIVGAEFLRGKFDVHSEVVFNGIDIKKSNDSKRYLRIKMGLLQDAFIAVMVANISSKKDHIKLLVAWKTFCELTSKDKKKFVLILAGRWDDATEQVKLYIQENGLEETVLLLGAVDDIAGLLEASDIFVFSSRSEGSPNAVIEAMILRKPIVAYDIKAVRDVLDVSSHKYLAKDSMQFAKNIYMLYSNRSEYDKVVCANYERGMDKFSLEKNMYEMYEIMRKRYENCS